MSLQALPILFLNLGGEMLYILDQRLLAQKISQDKAVKVMQDITSTMFNPKFIEELFKHQPLYSKTSTRILFDRLAHASIMKLNTASMDKLYDLMTMVVKYQVSLCLRPTDLFLVTLNHLDSISKLIDSNTPSWDLVAATSRLLLENYSNTTLGGWQIIRQTLLNFFQDVHIRVSIFLKDKIQNGTGKFFYPIGGPLPFGFSPPGSIKTFGDSNVKCKVSHFSVGATFTTSPKEGMTVPKGDRVIKLGLNMYKESRPIETQTVVTKKTVITSSDIENQTPNPNASAQLDLLAQLISRPSDTKKSIGSSNFKLNLFQTDEDEEKATIQKPVVFLDDDGMNVVKIDASKKSTNEELNKIMGELNVTCASASGGPEEDDLLALMDSV